MRSPTRRTLTLIMAIALIVGPIVGTSGAAPNDALRATVRPFYPAVYERSFRVLAADGSPAGSAPWRVVFGTGNCCENYLATTPDGRLIDAGSWAMHVSDDRGLTWQVASAPVPVINAEGAVAVAPDGDIVGIVWSAGADQLHTYKFEDGVWYSSVTPLHEPYADRPWLGIVEGPFDFAGERYPYAVIVRAGWPLKQIAMVSYDGLHYLEPAAYPIKPLTNRTTLIPVEASPQNDRLATLGAAGVTSLGPGAFLIHNNLMASGNGYCNWTIVTAARTQCYAPLDGQLGRVLADARGWLHFVRASSPTTLEYRISADAGATWSAASLAMPEGYRFRYFPPLDRMVDVKVNGSLKLAAISARAFDGLRDQDIVFKVSVESVVPRLTGYVLVGDGNADSAGGLSVSAVRRMDFTSVAIFPDGKLAVSFADLDRPTPVLAIEI